MASKTSHHKCMKRKIKVGILFGGRSAEHEVSLLSAKNIIDSIDKNKYEVVPISIDKRGQWSVGISSLISIGSSESCVKPDVIFPVLHGPFGEDGTVQGMLKLMNIPFVGAGVLGSALGMDKDAAKRMLRGAGIMVAKFITINKGGRINFSRIIKELGLPLFVKPASLGSSVGVNKVKTERQLSGAINTAFEYDNKILAEEFIDGREIECSILGNENPIASLPGEIIPKHEFYSYEAKYVDKDGAILKFPANLSKSLVKTAQKIAIASFKALCMEGMARVDFFLTPQNKFIVNEINTIPGFTNISMYPKLWAISGISYSKLIDRLIGLAIARHLRDSALKCYYDNSL